MTAMEKAKSELDRMFEEFVTQEAEQMRAQGTPKKVIDAVMAENRRRYLSQREAAATWALTANDNDLAVMAPQGSA